MTPILPFWFKQRQCEAEPVEGEETLKLTGPNVREAFIAIRQEESGRWAASLRLAGDGEEVASTPPECESPQEAWMAAFELYRTHVLI
jgi:hypothetical protein